MKEKYEKALIYFGKDISGDIVLDSGDLSIVMDKESEFYGMTISFIAECYADATGKNIIYKDEFY